MKVAMYCRQGFSDTEIIEFQMERLYVWADEENWTVDGVYSDIVNVQVLNEENRPQLQALMMDAVRRKFDKIIVTSLSHFYCDAEQIQNHFKIMEQHGIGFATLDEGFSLNTENVHQPNHSRTAVREVFAEGLLSHFTLAI